MHGSRPNPTDPPNAAGGGRRLELPYGSHPYIVTITDRAVDLVQPALLPAPRPLDSLIDDALASPIGAPFPKLPPAPRVTIIVSDPTRDEPRDKFVTALRRRLPADTRLTIAVATGTHGPCDLASLRLSPAALEGATVINHDGHRHAVDESPHRPDADARRADRPDADAHHADRPDADTRRADRPDAVHAPRPADRSDAAHAPRPADRPDAAHAPRPTDDLVELGITSRGTPVRVHRCLLEADLVVATGCIRPHYFAGFGAGCKAIFPGLGEATAIRINHRLKTEPGARAGVVDGNPCREDLEEAVALLPTPTFLLDGVVGPDHLVHDVVAGDLRVAFRAGADRARPWFTVRAPRAKLVIASDALPVSASLYQAAKIAAAVAPLVEPGGTLAIVAECASGVEPLATVNEAIFRIGVLPRLPADCRLVLVSSLPPSVVRTTLCDYAPSLDDVLASLPGERVVVVPRASHLLCEPSS